MLQDEQNRGLAFVNALTAAQRAKAILQFAQDAGPNLTEAWKDNVVLDYAGLPVTELTAAQRAAAARPDRRSTSATWTTGTRG